VFFVVRSSCDAVAISRIPGESEIAGITTPVTRALHHEGDEEHEISSLKDLMDSFVIFVFSVVKGSFPPQEKPPRPSFPSW
jgi:hypothetical protein